MGMHGMKRAVALSMVVAMAPASVWASVTMGGQAVFDACKGKSEGAAVEIVTPNGGTIKATCKRFKDRLVAVPEGAPPPPPNSKTSGNR